MGAAPDFRAVSLNVPPMAYALSIALQPAFY
jgi:hypothetical protein